MKLFIQDLKPFVTGLLFLLISSISIATPVQESFYENASFSKLETLVTQFVQKKKQLNKNDTKIKDHLNNISNIFLTAIFVKNPDYIKAVYKKFNQYSGEEKLTFANALIVVEGKEALNKMHYSFSAEEKLLSINDIDKVDLTNLKKEGGLQLLCSTADYLWSAFEATGNDKYLKNILNYLASEPLIIRQHAIRSGDVEPEISELIKRDKRYSFEKLLAYRTVLWSMQTQRLQHPDIEAKVQKILKQQPELNYRKDVK